MHDLMCGSCNHSVPVDQGQLMRLESDGSVTSYHLGCGFADKPCEDCGYHRRLCSECAE